MLFPVTAGGNWSSCYLSFCGDYIWQFWQQVAGKILTKHDCHLWLFSQSCLVWYLSVRWSINSLSLQIDKEEVSLRRVIGAKKDQYFLDKKMVT